MSYPISVVENYSAPPGGLMAIVYDNKKFHLTEKGYYCNRKYGRLHRHIWKCEVGPIPRGMDLHHIDFDKENNDISNLQLVTRSQHAKIHMQKEDNPNYGVPITEERREKLKEARSKQEKPGLPKRIKCIETGEIFESARAARRKYGGRIGKAASGKMYSSSDMHWRYI